MKVKERGERKDVGKKNLEDRSRVYKKANQVTCRKAERRNIEKRKKRKNKE